MRTSRQRRDTGPVRRVIVRITIGSFSVAALLGILALLRGGEFGQTQLRVLLTTLLVGVVSIAVLCFLATAGRASQPVGVAGGIVVVVPLVTALLMIWGGPQDQPSETVLKTFGSGAVVAATLAQASLLLALAEGARAAVHRVLLATLALAALLAAMVVALVVGYSPSEGGAYVRLLGVVAILDVLGTVVVPALAKLTGGDRGGVPDRFRLPPDLAGSVAELAARSGRDGGEVVTEAVRRYVRAGAPDRPGTGP